MGQKVHFLTPAYDGTCHVGMVWGLIAEIEILRDMGIEAIWDHYPGCCYLDISRNMLIDIFLKGDCTDAFFIDADVQWEPGATLKLLRHDRDIVGGVYPYKVDKEGYPTIYETTNEGRPVVDPYTGLIKSTGLPTGFMRIKRGVFEAMIEKFGESLLVEDWRDPENVVKYHCFFETPKIGKTKWGEDLYFCKRFIEELGGEIWIEPDIAFMHHGFKAFSGNFHDYLRRQPGGGGPPEKGWKFGPRE